MQIAKNRIAAIAIAIFLMFSMSASMMLLPTTSAHTPPWTIPTYAYINAAPNPVGVNQTVYINFWIDKPPPTAFGRTWGYRWQNMTVIVTKPDGTNETLGPFTSDATGGTWTTYVPKELGTYKFVGHFPAQIVLPTNLYPYYNVTGASGVDYSRINDTYSASTSKQVTVTVQQQPITTAYPNNPLPTTYWTNPINSMNSNWYIISGNWLGLSSVYPSFSGAGYDQNGNFNPYTTAPDSAHVLWTKPLAFGGQIGGELGNNETSVYATGTPYEPKFAGVIINGVLYYNEYPGAGNNPGPLTAMDLRTGTTLWTVDTPNQTLRLGMTYNMITGNQYGAHSYLFTQWSVDEMITGIPEWSMYDAMTGEWILNIVNTNPGTLVEGPNGEILGYTSDGTTLTMWNSTLCIQEGSYEYDNYAGEYGILSSHEIWRPPQGATINWSLGNQWTVPVATNISGRAITPALSVATVVDNVVLMTGITWTNGIAGMQQPGYRVDAGYSAIDGQLLWGPVNRTFSPFTNVMLFGYDTVCAAGEGVYTDYTCQTMTWNGYSLTTGQKLWTTNPENSSWGYFDNEPHGVVGYGCLYTYSMNGEVYCYNITTGAEVWGWNAGNPGVDTPYGVWPLGTFQGQYVLADGKFYVMSGHDYTPPLFRGAKLYCINATTGQLIWSSLSFNVANGPACADGILVWSNGYDNQLYAYGMGPSKTTVTAPDIGVTTATPITITGTVMDISAGSQQNAVAMNFPNGLPCVSDASMSQFMEAVYQQQPMPTNVTGVPVTLSVIDSNGNHYNIGTTTTNAMGEYGLTWTPDVPGNFTVIATFAGTNGYYGSSASTYFYASPAATVVPTAAPVSLASTQTYIMYGVIAIIVVIIIIGAILAMLMLRKRP